MSVPSRTLNSPLPVGATFLDRYRDLSDFQLKAEFDEMRSFGISSVILVSAGTLDVTGTKIDNAAYPSAYASTSGNRDLLKTILSLAAERDMWVYVGSLQTRGDWTTGAEFTALRTMNMNVYREIIQRYGSYKSLVGAYFAQELWVNWAWTEKMVNNRDYPGSVIASQFIRDIRQLKLETGKQLVTANAPVFKKSPQGSMLGLHYNEMSNAVNEILRLAAFDLLILQDGIGVGVQTGSAPLSELALYVQAARNGTSVNGTTLWAGTEFFEDDINVAPNVNSRPRHAFRPANVDRIAAQITAEQPYAEGFCMWTFGDHLSSRATYEPVRASRLAQSYRARYDSRVSLPLRINPLSYEYVGLQPNASYPDNSKTKLLDGAGVGYNAYVNGSLDSSWNAQNGPDAVVGFYTSTSAANFAVIFDLGISQKIGQVKVMLRNMGTPSAKTTFPYVYVSNDKASWVRITEDSRRYVASENAFGPVWDVNNLRAEGRYLRLLMPITQAGWLMIGEVEIYGEREGSPAPRSVAITQDAVWSWGRSESKEVVWNIQGPKIDQDNTSISLVGLCDPNTIVPCGTSYAVSLGATSSLGENRYGIKVPVSVPPGRYRLFIGTRYYSLYYNTYSPFVINVY